jgi:hypothetical protein
MPGQAQETAIEITSKVKKIKTILSDLDNRVSSNMNPASTRNFKGNYVLSYNFSIDTLDSKNSPYIKNDDNSGTYQVGVNLVRGMEYYEYGDTTSIPPASLTKFQNVNKETVTQLSKLSKDFTDSGWDKYNEIIKELNKKDLSVVSREDMSGKSIAIYVLEKKQLADFFKLGSKTETGKPILEINLSNHGLLDTSSNPGGKIADAIKEHLKGLDAKEKNKAALNNLSLPNKNTTTA